MFSLKKIFRLRKNILWVIVIWLSCYTFLNNILVGSLLYSMGISIDLMMDHGVTVIFYDVDSDTCRSNTKQSSLHFTER